MRRFAFLIMAIAAMVLSCERKPKFNINDYIQHDVADLEYTSTDGTVRVPFTTEGGVHSVRCLINGAILTDMILDSGCSGTLISISEARYLYSRGLLTEADHMGSSQAMIADGTIVENMVFNIKSIVIADKIECHNVEVTVSENANAPLLLGNEILGRIPSYTVDNEHSEIVFNLR